VVERVGEDKGTAHAETVAAPYEAENQRRDQIEDHLSVPPAHLFNMLRQDSLVNGERALAPGCFPC